MMRLLLVLATGCAGDVGEPPVPTPEGDDDDQPPSGGGGCEDAVCLHDRSDRLPPAEGATTDVAIADLDGDGRRDLVWAHRREAPSGDCDAQPAAGAIEVDRNEGHGAFEQATLVEATEEAWMFVVPADVDGDGDRDLVASRPSCRAVEVAVLENDGEGGLSERTDLVPPITADGDGFVTSRVAVSDVDADGDPDLLVPVFADESALDDRPSVLLVNRDGHYERAPAALPAIPDGQDYTLSAAFGDLTGDGAPDLLLGEAERSLRLLVNDGAGQFSDQSSLDPDGAARMPLDAMRPIGTALADLDGDGDLDVAVVSDRPQTTQGPVLLGHHALENDGAGHFRLSALPEAGPSDARGVAAADFDGDDRGDVLVGCALPHGGRALLLYLMGEDGPTLWSSLPRFDRGVSAVAVGDVDGDERPDVAAAVEQPSPSGDVSSILLLGR